MDVNVHAFRIVKQATEDVPPTDKNKRAASRRGGLIGGRSRAVNLTSEKRREIARKASAARWHKKSVPGE